MHEAEKEVCHLRFRREVLEKEKELLAQFADHVAKVHSIKVRFTPSSSLLLTSICVYMCMFVFILEYYSIVVNGKQTYTYM